MLNEPTPPVRVTVFALVVNDETCIWMFIVPSAPPARLSVAVEVGNDTATVWPAKPVTLKVGAAAVPVQVRLVPQVRASAGETTTVDVAVRPLAVIEPKFSTPSVAEAVTVRLLRISA